MRRWKRLALIPILIFVTLAIPALADDWPQFRGPNRDGISQEKGLLRAWPQGGPEIIWSLDVTQGYAGAAIHGGRVYFNDYDLEQMAWLVRAVSLDTGEELWRFQEKRRIRPNHGITRTVPAVDGSFVISLDPKAVLHGLDAKTGKELWRKDLVQEYGTKIPPWYNGQCPLLGKDTVLIATGGEALMVALDRATGEEKMRAANPKGWAMSHASLMPATLAGMPQYLYNTLEGTMGIALDGELLWHFPFKFNVAVAPSPLAVGEDRVFITAGYEAGGALLRVQSLEGGKLGVEELSSIPANEWNSEVHTPIIFDDHLFAVGRKKRGLFTCLDKNGAIVWESGGQASFGLGSFLLADGLFFLLEGKTGVLRLVEASTTAYKELGQAQILGGHDVWAPMALSNGKLVIRDMQKMVCVKVGGGGG